MSTIYFAYLELTVRGKSNGFYTHCNSVIFLSLPYSLVQLNVVQCYAWFNSYCYHSPGAHPRGFAIFSSLGVLFPTPGHKERNNSPPPRHFKGNCTVSQEEGNFYYVLQNRRGLVPYGSYKGQEISLPLFLCLARVPLAFNAPLLRFFLFLVLWLGQIVFLQSLTN